LESEDFKEQDFSLLPFIHRIMAIPNIATEWGCIGHDSAKYLSDAIGYLQIRTTKQFRQLLLPKLQSVVRRLKGAHTVIRPCTVTDDNGTITVQWHYVYFLDVIEAITAAIESVDQKEIENETD